MSIAAVVVDYGVGNVHSVLKALAHEGAEARLSSDPLEIAAAPRLVVPGVGAFGDGMRELEKRGLVQPIRAFFQTGRPLLGICLGMQLLLTESTEFGVHAGLGIIPGRVEKIPVEPGWKIPHVGWNRLAPPAEARWNESLLDGLERESPMVYFVHSFHAQPENRAHVLANVRYGGVDLCAAVRRDNAVGFQFHPEKSGPLGLRLIHRFVRS
ncbi:MAG TPA: imidazole glycerol phosphate synthase subunit HisH [Labilithrix sp.]|nr:imidazole glycerol phosphate synthase subunit HisH [Labilithrix sp.]